MTKGRPRLPEGEKMVSVSLRLPKDLVEWYDDMGVNSRSDLMRAVLEHYKQEQGDMT